MQSTSPIQKNKKVETQQQQPPQQQQQQHQHQQQHQQQPPLHQQHKKRHLRSSKMAHHYEFVEDGSFSPVPGTETGASAAGSHRDTNSPTWECMSEPHSPHTTSNTTTTTTTNNNNNNNNNNIINNINNNNNNNNSSDNNDESIVIAASSPASTATILDHHHLTAAVVAPVFGRQSANLSIGDHHIDMDMDEDHNDDDERDEDEDDSDQSPHARACLLASLSDDIQERYSSFVRARRASRSKLRMIRGGIRVEDDDGSVPTFCPYCNKEYRQNNSFYKHLYEHHPYWQSVSKELNISKHQQVMLMQTAELLLSLRDPETYGRQPLVKF